MSSDPATISDYVRRKAVEGSDTDAETVEAMRASLEQALVALSDLRVELADERVRRERAERRNVVLEAREERHREVSAGKWDDELWEGK